MIVTHTVIFPKFRKRTKVKLALFVLIMLGAFVAFFVKDIIYPTVFGAILFICALWYDYVIGSRENPTSYFDQQLTFNTHVIHIGEKSYEINNLNNIRILINDYDGQIMSSPYANYVLNGTNNQLSFIHLKEKVSISFYIMSEVQKEQFCNLFEVWYNEQISFYEGNAAGKTYLLKSLSYQEIQEFKKHYKIG